MISRLLAALALAGALATSAFAQPARVTCDHRGCRATQPLNYSGGHAAARASDPRPTAWCGWWLRQQLGVADRDYNRARAWAHYGVPAHGPAIGAIVVWPHHVGIITGRAGGRWVVTSGNDGHAVRSRARSLKGAIAFRWPQSVASR